MGFFDDVVGSVKKFVRQTGRSIAKDPLRAALNVGTFGVYEVVDRAGIADAVHGPVSGPIRMQRELTRSNREQSRVAAQALQASQNQASLAMQEQNKANQRRPDIAAILARTIGRGAGGASSTQLTGVGGVPKRNLKLGDTSLLGE